LSVADDNNNVIDITHSPLLSKQTRPLAPSLAESQATVTNKHSSTIVQHGSQFTTSITSTQSNIQSPPSTTNSHLNTNSIQPPSTTNSHSSIQPPSNVSNLTSTQLLTQPPPPETNNVHSSLQLPLAPFATFPHQIDQTQNQVSHNAPLNIFSFSLQPPIPHSSIITNNLQQPTTSSNQQLPHFTKSLHKPRQSSKIFEANELATLRMSHKVDKLAEQKKMFMQNLAQANTLKRQESPQTLQRYRGHNAHMSLFNNILRLKLEKAFT
jgi:hypothetical protein